MTDTSKNNMPPIFDLGGIKTISVIGQRIISKITCTLSVPLLFNETLFNLLYLGFNIIFLYCIN